MTVTSPLAMAVVAAAKRLSSRFVEFAFMLYCAKALLNDNWPTREAYRRKRKKVTAEKLRSRKKNVEKRADSKQPAYWAAALF
jgi:broad specificity polyphosphatase/5'/3'-nucleotidase SurE